MSESGLAVDIDFIEELRLRRWARENYAPADQRDAAWHPIIHQEMSRKDREDSVVEPTLVGSHA